MNKIIKNGLPYFFINEDCFNVFPSIKNKSIDIILVDTPYGTTKNKWDSLLDLSLMWKECKRVIKDNGAIIHFAQDPYSSILINSHIQGYKHKWIWNKKSSGNFAVAKYQPLSITEDILIFTSEGEKVNYYPLMRKGKLRYRGSKNANTNGEGFGGIKQVYYQSDEYYPTNLLDFSVVDRKKSIHPSQKPVELLEYLIETYSKEGDKLLDFCAGVMSTSISCYNKKRKCISIELNKDYYLKGLERWKSHSM